MALIKCPQCGRPVSSYASECFVCGCNLEGLKRAVGNLANTLTDMFQETLDLPQEEQINFACAMADVFFNYLSRRYGADTAWEIFISFMSICFAADGKLSYDEYDLMMNVMGGRRCSYNECLRATQSYLNSNSLEDIDVIIAVAPKNVREAVAFLCMAIMAIDGVMTVDEKDMCFKYLTIAIKN